MRLRRYLVVPFVLVALTAACGDDDNDPPAGFSAHATAVERQLLASTTSAMAPGQDLELTRVIIPGGMDIAPHTHPGPQLAVIVEGTLTYTIIRGEAQVVRRAGMGDASNATAVAGQTVDLNPGDAVIETTGMVHTARNAGNVAVVIYLSSLFPAGAPASSPAQ